MSLSVGSKEEDERVEIVKEWEKQWKHGTEEVESNGKIEKKNERLKQKGAHFLIKEESVWHWSMEKK